MRVKIRNYYYLIAGLLALLFAITHAWNGHSTAIPTISSGTLSLDTQIIFTYVWHIITAENAVFGLAFLFMTFRDERSKTQLAAWLILSILIVRLTVILGVTAFLDASALMNSIIDSVAIVIYVTLIILGTRMQNN